VSEDHPDVSVLIPTRNRAEHLASSLNTVVAAAEAAAFPTEVVVVDNASADSTASVLRGFASHHPVVRLLEDPVPGKSGVLNRALSRVRGSVVVFTDDDVHVPESWVTDMAGPILRDEVDAVCGRVVLAAQLARPWLDHELRTCLAELLDVSGDAPGMVGANMATTREAAMAVGFDEELGPGARGFADDVLFNLRLKSAGYRLAGCTGPPVEHHLDSERLSYDAMRSLAQRNGASHAYLWHHWLGNDLRFLALRRIRAIMMLTWATRKRWSLGPSGISSAEYGQLYKVSFFAALADERARPGRYKSPASE